MITEITRITIDPNEAEAFEAAVAGCADAIRIVEGCYGLRLRREIEDPAHYYLVIDWESVEHHKRIQQTDIAKLWAEKVVIFYRGPSLAVHANLVKSSF